MNSSSAYGNVLIAAPTTQPANNVPARSAVNDSTSRDFQRAMDDARYVQQEKEKPSIAPNAKNKNRNHVAVTNRSTTEKNNTRVKDTVSDKSASQSTRSAQSDAEKKDTLENSNNNAQSIADQSLSDEKKLQSANDKLHKNMDDESEQKPLVADENQSAGVAFPLDTAIKLPASSSGPLLALPSAESSTNGIVGVNEGSELNAGLTTSFALKTSGLTSLQPAQKNQSSNAFNIEKQTETGGLSGLGGDGGKVAISLENSNATKTSDDANKQFTNAKTFDVDPATMQITRYQGFTEPTMEHSTPVSTGEAIAELSASGKAINDIASGLIKNASGRSVELTEDSVSLELGVDPAADATTTEKNVFEKMFQALTTRHAAVTHNSLESINGNSGGDAATIADTPTTFASAAESLSRTADSLSPAGRSFVVQTAIPVGVGQPQWSEAVGEKVLWLAAQNVTAAEIHLDPPDLGPMHVKVSVNQEQASVSFTSHHAGVREVLDQSLQRLRDMFSEQGLQLMNVDVSDKSFHHQQGDSKGSQAQGSSTELIDEESPVSISAIVQQRLVDHYA